ncbi:MAG: MFS transporter [Acidimicrobiales bacterium]
MPTPPADDPLVAESVWAPQHRALAIGLLLTVTMIAFEALGITTAMPAAAADLDGLALYGWVFTAAFLSSLIGIAFAGRRADRTGPAGPYALGITLFAAGLVIAGSASEMIVVVAGRVVQGLGIGVLPAVVYTSIGRAFTDRARARMFALLSSAWVVPGLVGPAIAGWIAENVGWRWVFFGVLPLVPLNAFLTLPALRRLGPPASDAGRGPRRGIGAASLALTAGAGVLLAALSWRTPLALVPVLGGAIVVVLTMRRLTPPGTLHAARGLPAAVATRGLQTCAFFTANSFLPLAVTDVRGRSSVTAGLLLTSATLAWTAGAWIQDRKGHGFGRGRLVAVGLATLASGLSGLLLVLVPPVPLIVPAFFWTVAGLGMGMSYAGISLVVLATAPPGAEGEATSSMQLTDVLGNALGTGIAGAAIAAGVSLGWPTSRGLLVAFGLAVASATTGAFTSRRLPMLGAAEPVR